MKIAVMSDSHDHLENMDYALKICKEENVERILHCGDFVAPFMLHQLAQSGICVDGVFGNNDGDIYTMTKLSLSELKSITLHNLLASLEIDGLKIAMTHTPAVGVPLLESGQFDLVCWGHTHVFEERQTDGCLGLNPGDIMGKDHTAGFCIFDTQTREFEHILLK